MENQENIQPNKDQKITTPTAIIVAGFVIMIGIIISNGGGKPVSKTLSEQVGVSKEKLNACIKDMDTDALKKSIDDSVDKAMVHIEKRGTPYSVVIGKDGVKTEILGADSYASVKQIVDDASIGKVEFPYNGNLPEVTPDEHIFGNPEATITIVEYSDFECPFCKQFDPVLKRIVQESNGSVRWVYRNYPLHQHSYEKLMAAECVAKIKDNDTYWKYADLLFGTLKTSNDSISEQL